MGLRGLRQRIYVWDLLRFLVARDMKLLYKRSMLGIAWTMITPLLQLVVFAFVFRGVLAVSVSHFFSYAFIGLWVWNWFQISLFQATGVITANRSLIRQPGFPAAILPVAVVLTGLVHFLIAIPILLAFLLMDNILFNLTLVFLPIFILIQSALTLCLAYPLAALNVTFRDVQHILGVLLNLLFYLTPVFYRIDNIPAAYRWVYRFNPMVHLLESYRSVLLATHPPEWRSLLLLASITLVLLPIGHRLFRRQSDRFVEEL